MSLAGPNVQNLTQKVRKRVTPSEDWPIHTVTILRYCDTLESARKAAEESQYSSAPETLGRGYRRRRVTSPVRNVLNTKQNKIYSSSSEDDNDESDQGPELPNFPHNLSGSDNLSKRMSRKDTGLQYSSRSHDKDDDLDNSVSKTLAQADTLLNGNDPNRGRLEVTASGSRIDHNATDVQINCKFDILEDKIDSCLRLLGKLITEVRDLNERSVSNNNGNSGFDAAISVEVDNHLKLDTRHGVTTFEAQLESSTAFENEFIQKVKQVGGANGKDYTERALAFIFSNNFAKENTWEGKMTKYKVNTLKVVQICEKIILEKFPTFDKSQFNKAGTNWFRLGNQRAGSQPKQVMKKRAQAETGNQRPNEQNA